MPICVHVPFWFCGKVIAEPRGKIERMTSDLSKEQENANVSLFFVLATALKFELKA
jgi:hypothetical protein